MVTCFFKTTYVIKFRSLQRYCSEIGRYSAGRTKTLQHHSSVTGKAECQIQGSLQITLDNLNVVLKMSADSVHSVPFGSEIQHSVHEVMHMYFNTCKTLLVHYEPQVDNILQNNVTHKSHGCFFHS